MIHLKKITEDNLDEALAIKVKPEQEMFIAPVSYSLAQSYVLYDILTPLLIYANDHPVGFILLLMDPIEKQYEVCRLMIDKNHQGNGYGKKALQYAIDILRNNGAEVIELSHQDNNYGVGPLYEEVGFKYTGEIDDGEVMMELKLF